MFIKNNLYTLYNQRRLDDIFSLDLPDVTKRTTLNNINYAINLCKFWNTSLDIGCGSGHYTSALSAKFKKSVGVEIDTFPEQAMLIKKYPNIEIFNGPMHEYHTQNHFDFILLADIFEHIPDIKGFVQEISCKQKNGGIVYILTPNPVFCGPATESQIFHTETGYHGHIDHYTRNEVVGLMKHGEYHLEYFGYEETAARQRIKRVVKALSRRDKSWSKNFLYKFFRPALSIFLDPLYYVLDVVCFNIEEKNHKNPYNTMAQILVFKKLSK